MLPQLRRKRETPSLPEGFEPEPYRVWRKEVQGEAKEALWFGHGPLTVAIEATVTAATAVGTLIFGSAPAAVGVLGVGAVVAVLLGTGFFLVGLARAPHLMIVKARGATHETEGRLTAANVQIAKLKAQLEAERDLRGAPLLDVEVLHVPGIAQLWVKNISGAHDSFTAQVVGWDNNTTAPVSEGRVGYHMPWGGEGGDTRVKLNVDEKEHIDFAWLGHREAPHTLADPQNWPCVTVFVAGFDAHSEIMPKGAISFHAYDVPEKLISRTYRFMLRFTAERANRSQDVCVILDLMGRPEDHPRPDLALKKFLKPQLWLRLS